MLYCQISDSWRCCDVSFVIVFHIFRCFMLGLEWTWCNLIFIALYLLVKLENLVVRIYSAKIWYSCSRYSLICHFKFNERYTNSAWLIFFKVYSANDSFVRRMNSGYKFVCGQDVAKVISLYELKIDKWYLFYWLSLRHAPILNYCCFHALINFRQVHSHSVAE